MRLRGEVQRSKQHRHPAMREGCGLLSERLLSERSVLVGMSGKDA